MSPQHSHRLRNNPKFLIQSLEICFFEIAWTSTRFECDFSPSSLSFKSNNPPADWSLNYLSSPVKIGESSLPQIVPLISQLLILSGPPSPQRVFCQPSVNSVSLVQNPHLSSHQLLFPSHCHLQSPSVPLSPPTSPSPSPSFSLLPPPSIHRSSFLLSTLQFPLLPLLLLSLPSTSPLF